MKTKSDLRSLAERRAWDKEIVVWQGSVEELSSLLPSGADAAEVQKLDLLDLVTSEDLSEDDARSHFRRALESHLKTIAPGAGQRRILIVSSAAILAHFNTGLASFFSWFCSDRGLVILQVDGVAENLTLPPEFEFRPNRLIEYFVQPDHAKEIYS